MDEKMIVVYGVYMTLILFSKRVIYCGRNRHLRMTLHIALSYDFIHPWI